MAKVHQFPWKQNTELLTVSETGWCAQSWVGVISLLPLSLVSKALFLDQLVKCGLIHWDVNLEEHIKKTIWSTVMEHRRMTPMRYSHVHTQGKLNSSCREASFIQHHQASHNLPASSTMWKSNLPSTQVCCWQKNTFRFENYFEQKSWFMLLL